MVQDSVMPSSASNIQERVINIAKLDVPTFEAVEADASLTQEAGMVVAASSLIGSLGYLFIGRFWLFLVAIAAGLVGWFVWSWLAAFIAQKLFKVTTTDTGEMLRTTGYAHGPRLLGIIPFLGFVGAIWSLVAVVVGMRQAGEMTTTQAVITALVGFLPYAIAMGIFTAILL